MITRINPKPFNTKQIKAWKLQLTFIPQKTQSEESKRTLLIREQDSLQHKLHLQHLDLKDLEDSLTKRRNTILRATYPQDIPIQLTQKDEKAISRDTNVKELNGQIQVLKNDINEQQRLLEQVNQEIHDTYRALENVKLETQQLEDDINDAEKFLGDLALHPKELFQENLSFIRDKLTKFPQHPEDNDDNLRLCLYRIKTKLDILENEKINHHYHRKESIYGDLHAAYKEVTTPIQKEEFSQREWQIKFAQLNGFVWDLLQQYLDKNPQPNIEFVDQLECFLNKMHIKLNHDLPDGLALGSSTFAQFQLLKASYPDIYAKQNKVLNDIYKQTYDFALSNLHQYAIQENDAHHKQALELVNAIENDIKERNDKNEKSKHNEDLTPYYKIYKNKLIQAYKMYDALEKNSWDETTSKAYDKFTQIDEHLPGRVTVRNRVLGAMMGIAGSILFLVSAGAAIATFGGSSLLSGIGMAWGATLLTKAAILTVGLGSGAMAMGGWYSFYQNRQKGIAQKVQQCADSIAKDERAPELPRKF